MKKYILFSIIVFCALWFLDSNTAQAATRYVDSSVGYSSNGQSWATAWKAISNITGLSAGDIVYFSGGSTGNSKTYTGAGNWTPAGGTSGNRITYKIGQDAGHNGTAIFNCGGSTWLDTPVNINMSGDAGDGNRHFQLTNCGIGVNGDDNGTQNIRISYVNFGSTIAYLAYFRTATGIEIDNNFIHKLEFDLQDAIMYADFINQGTYGVNSIHHNIFEYVAKGDGSGLGEDGIKSGLISTDVYNNNFITYTDAGYNGGQHTDAIQGLGGAYARIYNNTFTNNNQYPIFLSAYYGPFTHVRIYNNVLYLTSSTVRSSSPPQGIVVGIEPSGCALQGSCPTFNDIIIANNTIVDYGGHACINFRNDPGSGTDSLFTNSYVYNNLCFSGGGFEIENTVTTANNITTSLATPFQSYTSLSASNNFHLQSGSSLVNAGTDMSIYFITDKDGIIRPQGSAWDIGAYEYTGSSPIPYCGDNSCNGAETCSSCSADCGTCPSPTPSPASAIEAESGNIISPMQIVSDSSASSGSYIQTNIVEQGTASYSFNIASAGTYKIVARVYAPDASSDSCYFKIDNLAEDIWDLNPTGLADQFSLWREDEVTARGTGTFDYPQYDPYTVNLTAGNHTLAFRGRETNAKLDYFYLVKVGGLDTTPPASPTGLTII